MMPTGSGKVGQRIRTPDGIGTVTVVHNQDNVTVEFPDRKFINPNTKKEQAVKWIGDISECDLWCEDCEAFHTHEKHTKKAETANV